MTFSVGDTVGPYKITAYIGQGGTATIFKAHQISVDRDVALKVIHPALQEDKVFVTRLKREAMIIAKLNHPNIVTLYDLVEFDQTPCLVLQYIDGTTLRDLLRARRLKFNRIMEIARSVANALSYAHGRGILHRDIKPSNILIDKEGHAYLTDFGLARLAMNSESTISQDMMVGSPQYVSPEQAKSDAVDVRTDVYSFGIVLYEMFARRAPFQGDTPYSTILAQINTPPPRPRLLNPAISPQVEQVLLKALAKEPNERYASIREMMNALEDAIAGRKHTAEPTVPPASSSQKQVTRWTAVMAGIVTLCVLLVCIAGMALFASGFSGQTVKAAGVPTRELAPVPVSISTAPQGKIVYTIATGDSAEQHSIWIVDVDGTDARRIIDSANWPSLAPDGKQVAYHRLKEEGIYVANIDGGNPRRIVNGETCCVQWSPDGKRLTYVQGNLKRGDTKIMVVNPDGSSGTEVTAGFNPAWSPDSNRIAYAGCQPNSGHCGLFVYNFKSKNTTMITRDNGGLPQWSPLGDKIVYQANDSQNHTNLFVVNADGLGIKQLTFGKSNDGQPVWSNDGNFIFWRSDQNGTSWAIYVMRADGSNQRVLIKSAIPDGNLWARESLSTGP